MCSNDERILTEVSRKIVVGVEILQVCVEFVIQE